jgi:hypothetical protein
MNRSVWIIGLVGLAAAGCGKGGGSGVGVGAEQGQATPVPGQVAAPPGVKGPVTSPEQQSYSEASIKAIPEGCSNAHVMLASAPTSVGADYGWPWSKQAMLVNLQYKAVRGKPSGHGEVSFSVHQADKAFNNAWLLIAHCADGSTCNHLAAMYKAVVKSSGPQVICGPLPASFGREVKTLDMLPGGAEANLPTDVIGKCARIAACTVATTPTTTEDVGLACQKAPSSYKVDCATKYPCANVLSCMGR